VKWLYDRYLLTPILGVYFMLLVGFGTYQMFINPELINGSSASAYLTLMGLPALIVGLIKWRFETDEMDK
jgi:hypothetical protein